MDMIDFKMFVLKILRDKTVGNRRIGEIYNRIYNKGYFKGYDHGYIKGYNKGLKDNY